MGKNVVKNNVKGTSVSGDKKKKKWNPENKFFHGSVQEGLGFAFRRKQKVQQQYKKLLRKEKWRIQDSSKQPQEEYPEHLKHLYMAEKERLNKEELLNSDRRRKGRDDAEVDEEKNADSVDSGHFTRTAETGMLETSHAPTSVKEVAQCSQIQSSQEEPQKHKKWKKMSSYQKMKEEYEKKTEERERRKEEYLKNKAEREEALKKYKEKKLATYQLLKQKTKKGQPKLNLQMELLLQKIQAQSK